MQRGESERHAKTIVIGKTIVIIPHDNTTLEVLQKLQNMKAAGPRQSRIIIYDVDKELTE